MESHPYSSDVNDVTKSVASRTSSESPPEATLSVLRSFRPPGFRHLEECDELEYLSLSPCDVGCYELIDNVLRACPLMTGPHSLVIQNLSTLYHMRKHVRARSTSNPSSVLNENYFLENCIVKINSKTFYRPDITIGMPNFSEKASFGEHNIPQLVCEVTSQNRSTDLNEKEDLYAELGIPHYVIVDLHATSSSNANRTTVFLGVLKAGHYQFKAFESKQTVVIPLIGEIAVDDLRNTTKPSEAIRNIIQEDKQRMDLIRKDAAEKVALAKKEATEQVAAANRRADKYKGRSQIRKEKLRKFGIPDSSSSSTSGSPDKPKR